MAWRSPAQGLRAPCFSFGKTYSDSNPRRISTDEPWVRVQRRVTVLLIMTEPVAAVS